MKLKTTSLLIAATLFGAAVAPAQANNDAMVDLLKVLRDKGTISAQDFDLLTSAARADKEAFDATDAKVEKAGKSGVKVTTKGKLKIASTDGNWSFQPIGRVMWDAVSADADSNNSSDDWDGTELRRARLGFQGSVYDWGYKFEADFATGNNSDSKEVVVKDAYIKYSTKFNDTKFGLKLGQSHIPFGLNTKVSSKYMTFMDRPLFADSNISPARQSGAVVSLAAKDYSWTLASSVTVGSIKGGYTDEDDTGTTFALRGSFLPYMEDKNHLLQIGAGYMNVSDNESSFKFSQHLVAHKDHTKISSGSIAAGDYDGSDAFTIDALGVYGSFHAMAEYLDYSADSAIANNDIDIDGFAIEAGYFLTGESLKWKKGYTSGVKPKSSAGAWQVAARFESLDIDDGNLAGDDEAKKWTIGLNYYPTQNVRLMLNYDHITSWDQNGADTDQEPSAIKFRAQAKW
ncbi:MAG: porin [Gammaproteobacteria bacterium]|nr:MAG: porin [Gammaproteobacteria bacterium]